MRRGGQVARRHGTAQRVMPRRPSYRYDTVRARSARRSVPVSAPSAHCFHYVIDVAAGEEIPRKGGPAITRSDILVINKTDLAPHVGASLEVMERDALKMRGGLPTIFASLKAGHNSDKIFVVSNDNCNVINALTTVSDFTANLDILIPALFCLFPSR